MSQGESWGEGEVLRAGEPPASLFIDADGWHMAVELPGVSAADLVVTWQPGALTVEAQRALPHAPWRAVQLCEGRYGRLARLFAVPDAYDATRAQAVLEQGVLRISLPPRDATSHPGRPLRLVTDS